MSTMTAGTLASVETTTLADGIVVRLGGVLDSTAVHGLRNALLRIRPAGCDDVMVDASRVSAVTEEALAVLVAAAQWTRDTGARLAYSAISAALLGTARVYDVVELLPRLPDPGGRADEASASA